LGTLDFGLKSRVGIFKTSKKRKKNDKKFLKRGKKEKNEEKLKKTMQKVVQFALCFQNRAFSRCASRVRLPMAQVASGVDCGG
jgi:hypothetical protein